MTTVNELPNGPAVPPSFLKSVISKLNSAVASSDSDAQLHHRQPRKSEISDLPSPAAASAPAAIEDLRCKFSFSDGRQCRMPRAAHHAYLCAHHASKEAAAAGATSFPELEALCADLTTAANINRAVSRVFLLLAQGRMTERQALSFAALARLLLRTLPAIRDEWLAAFGRTAYSDSLKAKLLPAAAAPPENASKPRPQNAPSATDPDGLDLPEDRHLPITPPSRPVPISAARSGPAPASSRPETSAPQPNRTFSPVAGSSVSSPGALSPALQPTIVVNPLTSEAKACAATPVLEPAAPFSEPEPSPAPPPIRALSAPAAPEKEPRMVWIEVLQRYVPESGL